MRILFAAFAAFLVSAGTAFAQQAKIETSLGTITIALDAQAAPKTVANFIAYAREGHFDGTCVYRVVPSFVIQMGSYDADGNARPTHATIPLESAGAKNLRGTVAMARGDAPDSADAEFFINLSDNGDALDPHADAAPNTTGYAVFGHVTDGMDVVDKIAASVLNGGKGPFPDAAPAFPVVITKVTVTP